MRFLISVFLAAIRAGLARATPPVRLFHHRAGHSRNSFHKKEKPNMKYRPIIIALAISAATTFGPAYGQTTEGQSVGAAIERVATGLAGRIGFAAQEIGGDDVIAFNGDETFVMASAYKVAIATAVLDRVDRGELRLDQLVEVTPDMMVVGETALAETFVHPGLQLSVANLIEVMITESDNTATDVSMGLAGGPAAVTENLRRLGINDFRVDRLTGEILRDVYDLPGLATPEVVAEAYRNNPALVTSGSIRNPDFEADPARPRNAPCDVATSACHRQWHGDEPREPRRSCWESCRARALAMAVSRGCCRGERPSRTRPEPPAEWPTTSVMSRCPTVDGLPSSCSRTAARQPCRTGIARLPRSPARCSTTSTLGRWRSSKRANVLGVHALPVRLNQRNHGLVDDTQDRRVRREKRSCTATIELFKKYPFHRQ